MADQPDFDAADIADAILGLDQPTSTATPTPTPPPAPRAPTSRGALGWVLLVALIFAVSIAISLAVQLDPTGPSNRVTPPCGGLYSNCCDDRDDRNDRDDDPEGVGLFDEETEFADRDRTPDCSPGR